MDDWLWVLKGCEEDPSRNIDSHPLRSKHWNLEVINLVPSPSPGLRSQSPGLLLLLEGVNLLAKIQLKPTDWNTTLTFFGSQEYIDYRSLSSENNNRTRDKVQWVLGHKNSGEATEEHIVPFVPLHNFRVSTTLCMCHSAFRLIAIDIQWMEITTATEINFCNLLPRRRRRRGRKSAKFYLLNLKYIITSTLITINWQRELLEPLPGAQYSFSSLTFSSYSVSGIWYSQKSYNNKFGVSSFLKKWRFIFLLLLSSSAAAPLPIPFMVGGLTIMSIYALWWCSAVHRVHIMWRWSIGGRERQGDTIITTNNNMSKYIANKATVSPKSDCHAREEGRGKHQV